MLFAMLGLGLALPFLAIGFIPALRRRLPKPGAWMDTFRRVMAIPMGLTALALIWLSVQIGGRGFAMFALVMLFGVVLALFVVGRLQRAGKMAWPAFGLVAAPFLIFGAFALPYSYEAGGERVAKESLHAPLAFSREALAEARNSGQPVFVWFTADWCVTCKVNESVAIEREATLAAFEEAGVVTMVGDWTVRDEEITSFLTEQGAAGVPLYLWYEPGEEAEQLPQVVTVEKVAPHNFFTPLADDTVQNPAGLNPGLGVHEYPLRVTVTVMFQGPGDPNAAEVGRLRWIVPALIDGVADGGFPVP